MPVTTATVDSEGRTVVIFDAPPSSQARMTPARLHLMLAGYTQRQFAAYVGYSPQYCGQIFRGESPSTPRFREALAAYLDTPVEILFPERTVGAR
ncbi:MAG: helix-turn-helix domain-containing protein [Actinomycetota bacterium]